MSSQKQGGGFFNSLIGVLIGLGLVVAVSPYLLWHAQSQNRAKDFSTANVVSADGNDTGYIVIEGMATNIDPLSCPQPGDIHKATPSNRSATINNLQVDPTWDDPGYFAEDYDEFTDPEINAEPTPTLINEPVTAPKNCIYTQASTETYESREVESCGKIETNQKVIKQLEDQCDDDGNNCKKCYLVNEYDWHATDTSYELARFSVGEYIVSPQSNANYIGESTFLDYVYTESATSPIVGDTRIRFTYFPSDQKLLIAGNSDNHEIEGAYDKKPYVISNKSYDGTLETLKSQDKTTGWMLRILSLVLMIVGMLMIVGPLTYMTNFLKFIPVLGKQVDRGFDSVVKFGAMVFGLVFWLIIFGLILIIKNIWIIILVLAILGAVILYLLKSGKVKLKKSVA